jgi:uridine monophosphate synthetase
VRTTFFTRLEERVAASGSLLCVGLDPRGLSPAAARDRCFEIIAATASHVAAFKPNSAFFEAMGPVGMEVLIEVVAAVPEGVAVLLDAKRGDISSSAEAYATAAFDQIGAGAVTVSPYLGADSIEPFLEHDESGVFVLARTSNPGAAEIQEEELATGEPLYVAVARFISNWSADRVGLVVGATEPEAMAQIREVVPEHWILAPGVGAQGGSLDETFAAGLRQDGSGILLPVSRSIAEAADPTEAVVELNELIATARARPRSVGLPEAGLAEALFDAGCVRFGDFELKSGVRSPIYLDLRNLAGHPRLLRRVAGRYLPLLDNAKRLAGVPLAGVPIATAVSLLSGVPMVYARPEAKNHGTRSAVEGPFDPGDLVVAVDDVATSGISVLDAVERLRGAGMEVDAAVVLIDRGGGAGAALAEAGIELRSVLSLSEVIESLRSSNRISDAEADRVLEFLGA